MYIYNPKIIIPNVHDVIPLQCDTEFFLYVKEFMTDILLAKSLQNVSTDNQWHSNME